MQPSTEHATALLSCVWHFPRIDICRLSQSGSAQDSLCLPHKPPFFTVGVVQPSRRHSPNALCFLHNPRAATLVEQPSTEQGFLQCVEQSPLRLL